MTEALDSHTASDQLHPLAGPNLLPRSNTDLPGQQSTISSPAAASHGNHASRAAKAPWEHRMRRAPFSDHEDADIARWAV